MKTRVCKSCNEELPMRCFNKAKGYYRHKCYLCLSETAQRKQDADRNRKFNAAVSWPVIGA